MADDTNPPDKKKLREGMQVFFGPHGDKNIGLEDEKPPVGAPVADPEKDKEKEKEKKVDGEVGPDGKPIEKKVDAEVPPEPKPKKVAKKKEPEAPPAPRVMDEEAITRVASETAARTAAEVLKVKEPAAARNIELDGLELNEEDKERIAEMQLAGRANPKFADLSERTMKFWKLEKDFIEQWKANPDNRGKTFDPAEHEEFYAKHEPQFDNAEFKKTVRQAERDALKAELKNEVSAEANKEVSKLRFETKWKEEAPLIDKAANDVVAQLVEDIDPELAKLLQVDNETVVSPETLDKIVAQDRLAGKVIVRESGYLARMIREVERLDRYPEHYQGDRQNPLHVTIFKAALDLEERIENLPKAQQVFDAEKGDNRMFINQGDYNRRIDKIQSSDATPAEKKKELEALNASTWTLDKEDVKDAVKRFIVRRVKEKVAELREIVGDTGKTPEGAGTQPAAKPTTTPPENTPAARPKPPSSPSGGGDKTTTLQPGQSTSPNIQERVDKVFFS